MTYAFILPIVAGFMLALVGGSEISKWLTSKPGKYKLNIQYDDQYLRDMEEQLNSRGRNPLLTQIAGRRRTTCRKKLI